MIDGSLICWFIRLLYLTIAILGAVGGCFIIGRGGIAGSTPAMAIGKAIGEVFTTITKTISTTAVCRAGPRVERILSFSWLTGAITTETIGTAVTMCFIPRRTGITGPVPAFTISVARGSGLQPRSAGITSTVAAFTAIIWMISHGFTGIADSCPIALYSIMAIFRAAKPGFIKA